MPKGGALYPIAPEALDGQPVLLIAIPRDGYTVAQFVAGSARWTGTDLRVRYDTAQREAVAVGSAAALVGCDPVILERFIVPEQFPAVAAAARGASAWVAAFVDARLAGALTLSMPFFGLAEGSGGKVLLFEGDPDENWGEDEEDAKPWLSEP